MIVLILTASKTVTFGAQKNCTHALECRLNQNESLLICGFCSRGIIGPFFLENEQGVAVTVNGERYRTMLNEILFTKIEETALRATQPKQHSMFCCEDRLSAANLMSFGNLGTVIICGVQ